MIWILLQLIFPAMLLVLPMALYKSNTWFMVRFYEMMTHSRNARRLYTRVLLITLLLFHYVYASGHPGDLGIFLSTAACAALFSPVRADRWLRALLDRPWTFGIVALLAAVSGFVPHLYTTAITLGFILLAALFYPSVRIMSEWQECNVYRIFQWIIYPGTFADSYHCDHHAKLPHDADNRTTIYINDSSDNKLLKQIEQ